MSIVGVLLAAGRGRRLGGNKQLAPWLLSSTSGTLIESAFDHVEVVCDEMIVVLGHKQREVEEALRPRVHTTVQSDADADMSKSIQVGLKEALRIKNVQCILLQLGDHPQVSPSTLDGLIASSRASRSVIAPRYQGRNGHPIAIPTDIARAISKADLSSGLADWFRMDDTRRTFLDVDDPSVVLDIDTPEDLARVSHLTR